MSASDSPTPDVSLREKAERATPGPWLTDERFPRRVYCDDSTGSRVADCTSVYALQLTEEAKDANTEYIAACSPDVILALLSRVERAEADVRRMDWITEGNHSVMCYGVGRWILDVPAESPRAAIDLAMTDAPTPEAPNAL